MISNINEHIKSILFKFENNNYSLLLKWCGKPNEDGVPGINGRWTQEIESGYAHQNIFESINRIILLEIFEKNRTLVNQLYVQRHQSRTWCLR